MSWKTGGGAGGEVAQLLGIYWSLLLGNVVEWYEFAVYGYLEQYMEAKFFRGSAVATWLGFGITFFARPLGGAAFGWVCDRFGRSAAVNLTIIGMLVATAGQGCLPTFDSGNAAVGYFGLVCLILCRLLQGMSAGGEISTISTYIAEVSNPACLGRCQCLIQITGQVGFLLAKAVVYSMTSVLSEGSMYNWGWRVPFVLSLVPGLISIWGRRFVPESDAYLAEKAAGSAAAQADSEAGRDRREPEQPLRQGTSIRSVIKTHSTNVILGMCGVASAGALQYGGFMWMNVYLQKRGLSQTGAMLTTLCLRLMIIVWAMPVGWLVDKRGIAFVSFVGAALTALLSTPLFSLLDAVPTDPRVCVPVIGLGFGAIGAMSISCFFFYVVELFPTRIRGVAVGLSYNLGLGLFGGLSPMAAEASLSVSRLGPGIVLSVAGLITCASLLRGQFLQRAGRVKLAHIRERPYFAAGPCCRSIGDAHEAKPQQNEAKPQQIPPTSSDESECETSSETVATSD